MTDDRRGRGWDSETWGLVPLQTHSFCDCWENPTLSILKEINPEHPLEGLMLKLQDFGHLTWRKGSLEKTLMLGKIERGRRRGQRGLDGSMASLTPRTWVWASCGSWWRTRKPGVLQSLGLQRVWHNWVAKHPQKRFKCFITEWGPWSWNLHTPLQISKPAIHSVGSPSWVTPSTKVSVQISDESSLVVQWLGLATVTAEGLAFHSLSWGGRQRNKSHKPRVTAKREKKKFSNDG